MARLVKHEATGPMILKVGDETKAVCMCGLSSADGMCDGSHRATKDEEEGKVYAYDGENRTEVS